MTCRVPSNTYPNPSAHHATGVKPHSVADLTSVEHHTVRIQDALLTDTDPCSYVNPCHNDRTGTDLRIGADKRERSYSDSRAELHPAAHTRQRRDAIRQADARIKQLEDLRKRHLWIIRNEIALGVDELITKARRNDDRSLLPGVGDLQTPLIKG